MLLCVYTLQPAHYDNVATKRREYTEDPSQAELVTFKSQVVDLQRKVAVFFVLKQHESNTVAQNAKKILKFCLLIPMLPALSIKMDDIRAPKVKLPAV